MVAIRGTRGNFVDIQVFGVAQTINRLRKKGKDVHNGSDLGTFQAANLYQQEVQESIIGNRAEPKSVDTGRFGNSIELDKVRNSIYKVFTKVPYSVFLEHGTSRGIQPRKHFHNSLERNRSKMISAVGQAVRFKLR